MTTEIIIKRVLFYVCLAQIVVALMSNLPLLFIISTFISVCAIYILLHGANKEKKDQIIGLTWLNKKFNTTFFTEDE